MKIYDIFCDASVTDSLRGACAGALLTERYSQLSQLYAVIQPSGTNNSGEICAVLQGVSIACNIKQSTSEPCRFNIFSDSIISIRGIREWIFHWIYNANQNRNNILISSSGKPVSNQIYFKFIFNSILLNNLEVYFYYQKGHVENRYRYAAVQFEMINGISLIRLGLTAEYISTFNDHVDGRTRDILRQYTNSGHISMNGIRFDTIANTSDEYITQEIPVPYINANADSLLINNKSFDTLNGSGIISRYSKLIHADEYPSWNKISKYIS